MKYLSMLLIVLGVSGCSCAGALAEPSLINMDKIAMIESRNGLDKRSINTGGVFQITKICLKDFNAFHKQKFTYSEMNTRINSYTVANWYFNIRIPQLLRHYKREVNTQNIIIAYNAGIKRLLEGYTPPITETYLTKYRTGKY